MEMMMIRHVRNPDGRDGADSTTWDGWKTIEGIRGSMIEGTIGSDKMRPVRFIRFTSTYLSL
jgi:hypothetical protein